jgi:hypothetical protein
MRDYLAANRFKPALFAAFCKTSSSGASGKPSRMAVSADVGDMFVRQMPWWITIGVLAITLCLFLRAILSFVFSKEAADHAVETLIADAIRALFRVVILGPIRFEH